jgi:zinc protease
MFDRYAWFVNYLPALESVTPADVQRAAQTWLSPQRRVVGIYRPESTGGGA